MCNCTRSNFMQYRMSYADRRHNIYLQEVPISTATWALIKFQSCGHPSAILLCPTCICCTSFPKSSPYSLPTLTDLSKPHTRQDGAGKAARKLTPWHSINRRRFLFFHLGCETRSLEKCIGHNIVVAYCSSRVGCSLDAPRLRGWQPQAWHWTGWSGWRRHLPRSER